MKGVSAVTVRMEQKAEAKRYRVHSLSKKKTTWKLVKPDDCTTHKRAYSCGCQHLNSECLLNIQSHAFKISGDMAVSLFTQQKYRHKFGCHVLGGTCGICRSVQPRSCRRYTS